MKLIIPSAIVDHLRQALHRAGSCETGGILVGEYLHDETFRLVALSVQPSGGGGTHHFVRDPSHHSEFLADFFQRTGQDYTRFNYLGEWHSHPCAAALPSDTDCETMDGIVRDPAVGANFAVLIITRLGQRGTMQLSATAFRAGRPPEVVVLAPETLGKSAMFKYMAWQPQRRGLRL